MNKNLQTRLAALGAALVFIVSPLANGVLFALSREKALTQYGHDIWTSENGLPQNTVFAITQTRDGYLWLGTEEGIVRFDGASFTTFDKGNTDEIKKNVSTALYEDKEGSLWIGTQGGGLNRFKDGKFTAFPTKNGRPYDFVYAIHGDKEGTLWLATQSGLNRFKDGEFTTITTKDGLSSDYVSSIYEDKEGSLWIGTSGGGLNRLKDGKFVSFTTKDGLSNDYVISIHEDKKGTLWIGTQTGLNRFKDGKFASFTTKDGLSHNRVRSIYEDKEGSLWIGTSGGGLNRLKDGKFTSFTTKDGLTDDFVLSVFEDREGSLWIGTQAGLNRFKDGKFTTLTTKEGLSQNVVRSIHEDKEGSIWIGTQVGLSRLQGEKLTSFTTKDGLASNWVWSIHEDREGSIWIGTQAGLSRFQNEKFTTFTTTDGLSSDIVKAILGDKDGSVWIGTSGGGLNRFKDGKFTSFTTKDGLSNDVVLSICEDKEGTLWIGTGGGLNRFKNGKLTSFTTKDGLSNDIVRAMYGDEEGSLWLGTSGGLHRFKDGKFTVFTTEHGLFDDFAFTILEDDHANLWMSCNKGIYRVSKKDLNAFADGSIGSLTSVSYGITDGMKANECNTGSPSGWRTRNGKLWFATIKGVVVIDPNNIKLNTQPPPVFVEKVILEGKEVNPREELQAPPGTGELEFHFTALSFLVPEKVTFKYKLEGFDDDWSAAGTQRIARYTNLPPGDYHFRVIASNNDGVWNETGATFEFYLQPHFYQTRWFYGLCALIAIFAVLGLYRLRVRQLRRRTQELEVTVDQRTVELKREQQKVLKLEKQATEQLMAGGFAHEMRNALAGSKLILDQALALDCPEPRVSLNLGNCRTLKDIYLGLKDELPEARTLALLAQMRTIFANEERIEEVMQLVCKATSRGLNITQQIMDYSKMGQQQPGKQSVGLHNLIVSMVNESREEFSAQGVVVEYHSEHEQLSLIGDETHFYSIIKNIVLNARDALIDPSVKDRQDRCVTITTALEHSTCSVVITDNGIGIPPANLRKVFEPFFSTKPAMGTGLGLGMARKMAFLYNGSIDVISETSKGTRVIISFPVTQPEAAV